MNKSTTQNKEQDKVTTVNGMLIELNTIAGVKGETHTATLILETFFLTILKMR